VKPQRQLLDFVVREWLLMAAATGLLVSSLYLGRVPAYSSDELTPILLLFALFVTVKGIEDSGFLLRLGSSLERGTRLPLKLVAISFLLSMVVTIDVSLVTMIPLVLAMNVGQRRQLVILVALTVHAGAALTPFGTPQNLFIFSFYDVGRYDFIRSIAPFSLGMLAVFLGYALFLKVTPDGESRRALPRASTRAAIVYGILLLLVVLCVLKLLPAATALLAVAAALIYDRRSLRVDYALLATFLCFIGLAGNIQQIIAGTIQHTQHIFVMSSILSQFISNVPTTLLLTRFTGEWEALLWGTNVGGFGSLMAALANLITYRLYLAHSEDNDTAAFTLRFVIAGYLAFLIGFGIYFGVTLLKG